MKLKLKLMGVALALTGTAAFAGPLSGFPVPSFNDAPELYERSAAQQDVHRAAPAVRDAKPARNVTPATRGSHPDPMHDSY